MGRVGAIGTIDATAIPRPNAVATPASRIGSAAQARVICAAERQRLPDRHLAAAAGRSHREQHADVRAGDQQDETGGGRDRLEQRPNLLHVRVMCGLKVHPPPGRRPRSAGPDERGDAIAGGRRGHALPQPHLVGMRRPAKRREHLGECVRMPVARAQDADDGERLRVVGAIGHVGVERPADHRGIAIEPGPPEAMADQRHCRTSRAEVRLHEAAPEHRAHGKTFDIPRRHPCSLQHFRGCAAA